MRTKAHNFATAIEKIEFILDRMSNTECHGMEERHWSRGVLYDRMTWRERFLNERMVMPSGGWSEGYVPRQEYSF